LGSVNYFCDNVGPAGGTVHRFQFLALSAAFSATALLAAGVVDLILIIVIMVVVVVVVVVVIIIIIIIIATTTTTTTTTTTMITDDTADAVLGSSDSAVPTRVKDCRSCSRHSSGEITWCVSITYVLMFKCL
jgi:uncharacterized membrane protein